MPQDTTTLTGKVGYVLDHSPEASESARGCVLAVWRTFYYHLIVNGSVALLDALEMPEPSAIRREWRIAKGLTRSRAKAAPYLPYYADIS